jgi:hypothetical protein
LPPIQDAFVLAFRAIAQQAAAMTAASKPTPKFKPGGVIEPQGSEKVMWSGGIRSGRTQASEAWLRSEMRTSADQRRSGPPPAYPFSGELPYNPDYFGDLLMATMARRKYPIHS